MGVYGVQRKMCTIHFASFRQHRKHIERINSLAAPYTVCRSMSHATWHCNYLNDHDVNDRDKWPRCYQENDHNAVDNALPAASDCCTTVTTCTTKPVGSIVGVSLCGTHAPDLGTPFSMSAFSFSFLCHSVSCNSSTFYVFINFPVI